MKAHETAARRDVVMPLWTEATLAQLSLPERAQVAATLRRFVEAEHPGPGTARSLSGRRCQASKNYTRCRRERTFASCSSSGMMRAIMRLSASVATRRNEWRATPRDLPARRDHPSHW